MKYKLLEGDCLEQLKHIKENTIDSCVTDPPAGISFMGKTWDTFDHDMFGKAGEEGANDFKLTKGFKLPMPRYTNGDLIGFQNFICEAFTEVYRVLKPGAHCFIWAIPRTSHHTAMGLERAGFEIRDIVTHVFGSGFPKSHNISKAIDRKFGNEGKVVGELENHRISSSLYELGMQGGKGEEREVESKEAKQWDGWGTALKQASEHWILCRKPLSEKTVADNVLKWGTGGINIDGSRIETSDNYKISVNEHKTIYMNSENNKVIDRRDGSEDGGRFPANFIHDGSDEVMEEFDKAGKTSQGHWSKSKTTGFGKYGGGKSEYEGVGRKEDGGSAARFFYCSKASGKEKNAGLDDMEDKEIYPQNNSIERKELNSNKGTKTKNNHPTVKPIKLMSYLINMITPPKGVVIDPFLGSGSTGVAAIKLGFNFIGIEKEAEYMEIAKKRIEHIIEHNNNI